MDTFFSILEFVFAIAILIILHELGHFAAARFFNIPVDEFGLGFPPRALSLWRRQGWIRVEERKIVTPAGRRILRDVEPGTWVEALVERGEAGEYRLKEIRTLDAESDVLVANEKETANGLRIRGEVTAADMGMLYSLNWLPFGGFVRIRGDGDPAVSDGLSAAKPWIRMVVFLAGPLTNLLIGVLLYTVIIWQGGIPTMTGVRIANVTPDSPAAQAGMLPDDVILAVNDRLVTTFTDVHDEIYANLGVPIAVTLGRGDETLTVSVVPRDPPPEDGAIGILMAPILTYQPVGLGQSVVLGGRAVWDQITMLLTLPAAIMQGQQSLEMARPVGYKGMFDMYRYTTEESANLRKEGGGPNFGALEFFAMISVSLGLLNLLPIPGLDGGRILFTLPEIFFRRALPIEWQNAVNFIFLVILFGLFAVVNVMDFVKPVQFP